MKVRLTGVAVAAACALLGAGLGVSGIVSGAAAAQRGAKVRSAQTASAKAAVAAAEAAVKKYEAVQHAIYIPPLTKPIPRHVRLAVLSCANQPACQTETAGTVAAAQKLGWTVQEYHSPLTPQGYQATWTSVLQGNPTAIIYAAIFPNANVAATLKQVRARHIPMVSISPLVADTPPAAAADGVKATVAGPAMSSSSGKLMGDAVVADAKGPAHALWVWDPTFAGIHQPIKDAFTKVVASAGGSVSVLQISVANIGQSVPGQIVSYLQSNPSIKYVVFAVSDFDAGVAQALAGAGLASHVKIVARVPEASNLVALKSGQEFAEVADELAAGGWRTADDMVRILSGEPIYQVDPAGWHQIFTKSNVTETNGAPPTPGVPGAFLKAWHLSGK